jgi:AcrR family transcriptional regulator
MDRWGNIDFLYRYKPMREVIEKMPMEQENKRGTTGGGSAPPKDSERRSFVKTKILTASMELFALNGYAETEMRDIARFAHIRVSDIYEHFPTKQDILTHITNDFSGIVDEIIPTKTQIETLLEDVTLDNIIKCTTFECLTRPEWIGRQNKAMNVILQEQFRVCVCRDFMTDRFLFGVKRHVEKVLGELSKAHKIRVYNPSLVAVQHVSVLYFWVSAGMMDTEKREIMTGGAELDDLLRCVYERGIEIL